MGFSSSKIELKFKEQMEKSICLIKINKEELGYGFLALSPETNQRILVTKIQSNYFYPKKIKGEKPDIEIILDNKKTIVIIPKIIYPNDLYKVTILSIEISKELNDDNFLLFDFDKKQKDIKLKQYIKKEIYIIPYKTKDEIIYPKGTIIDIQKEEYIFNHNCKFIDEDIKNFPFPIFSSDSYKVIGINESINTGIYLKNILDEFNRKIEKEKQEEKKLNEEKDNKTIVIENDINNALDRNKISGEIKERINENKLEIDKLKKTKFKNYYNDKNKLLIENNEQNIIIIMLEVKPEEINKEIFFLDNCKYINPQNIKRDKGFLQEIDNMKSKIKINIINPKDEKIQIPFDNKFIPKEEGIHLIEIDFPEQIKDCSYMFYGCINIIDIDLSNFDFQLTTNMSDMFNYCINLQKIKFPKMPIKNVINTSYMFNYCKKLLTIDLSEMNTENVISMTGMFQHCECLKIINLSNFDINNNTQLSCMFNDCYELKEINFSNKFNTKNVEYMPWMFYGCENLINLDLTSFNIDKNKIRDMSQMFDGCDKLKEIKIAPESKEIFYSTNSNMIARFKF